MNWQWTQRKANETENQYILRICSMKDKSSMSWSEIADILNNGLGHNYDESCYRKRYQSYNNMLSECNFSADEYANQLEQEKIELQKERYKLAATKNEFNRVLRQQGRFELFYENVRNAIEALSPPKNKMVPLIVNEDYEYVLTIADIQCGAKFDLEYNTYSMDEVQHRFDTLFQYVVQFGHDNPNMHKIHIIGLGDTIQGILRLTDLQLNESSVVNATVFVARLIAGFLNDLSEYFEIEYYHTPTSNHTQTRPLGTKASELACEDVEYIIGNYIKDALHQNKRVNVNLNFGKDYIYVPIFNYNIIAMHGHTIKNLDTALKDLSVAHGVMLDYIFAGHYHTERVISGNERDGYDTALFLCPSFQGTDPYALNKLGKSSKAACKIFTFGKKNGCVSTYKIILN